MFLWISRLQLYWKSLPRFSLSSFVEPPTRKEIYAGEEPEGNLDESPAAAFSAGLVPQTIETREASPAKGLKSRGTGVVTFPNPLGPICRGGRDLPPAHAEAYASSLTVNLKISNAAGTTKAVAPNISKRPEQWAKGHDRDQ